MCPLGTVVALSCMYMLESNSWSLLLVGLCRLFAWCITNHGSASSRKVFSPWSDCTYQPKYVVLLKLSRLVTLTLHWIVTTQVQATLAIILWCGHRPQNSEDHVRSHCRLVRAWGGRVAQSETGCSRGEEGRGSQGGKSEWSQPLSTCQSLESLIKTVINSLDTSKHAHIQLFWVLFLAVVRCPEASG